MVDLSDKKPVHQVVIIGGGFGGLYAAKSLAKANVQITLIDKRNFHLFQPLLFLPRINEVKIAFINERDLYIGLG